jgi:hypothetical protein
MRECSDTHKLLVRLNLITPHRDNWEPLPDELRVNIVQHTEHRSTVVLAFDHEYTIRGLDCELYE